MRSYFRYDVKPPRGEKDDRGLVEVITGWKFVGDEDEADKEYAERLTRRAKLAREKRAGKKQTHRRSAARRLRLKGR